MADTELSDEQLRAIGRISVYFGRLEFLIKLCIGSMIDRRSNEAVILTSPLSFDELTNVFGQLYRLNFALDQGKGHPQLAHFEKLIKDINAAAEKRNRVIHSIWFPFDSGKSIGIKFPRGRKRWFQPSHSEMDATQLSEIADLIAGVAQKVGQVFDELSEARESREAGQLGPKEPRA